MSQILDLCGEFVWMWNETWFIDCGEEGCFIWSDPEYGGDNTIRRYNGTWSQYYSENGSGRSKGMHCIRHYCGSDVKIVS